MKTLKFALTAIVLMPFFVSSTEVANETTIKNNHKQAQSKDKVTEKEKEAFLTRLLVKTTDKCMPWPLCR